MVVRLRLLAKDKSDTAEALKETEQDPVNSGPEREVGVLVLVTGRAD